MDLATENRIAAILLKEAAEIRRQADKEGALAYLRKPTVRGRPNSRFLTATVLGIQQANRAVEVDEMWRLRQKELEVVNRKERRSENESSRARSHKAKCHSECDSISNVSCSSSKREIKGYHSSEEGLRDDEVDEFLHSRAKRGRGTVGSRMDETGPYPCLDREEKQLAGIEFRDRAIIGPEKPRWLNTPEPSEDAFVSDDDDDDKIQASKEAKPDKYHSRKHKYKSKSRENVKKRYSKRHKHHK